MMILACPSIEINVSHRRFDYRARRIRDATDQSQRE